jgi:hypothetical protein
MLTTNDIALKEWAVICRELEAGRQVVLLRKGGIRDQSRGFSVDHAEFFLFPTYVHENEDELTGPARPLLAEVERAAPSAGQVRLGLYAEVDHVTEVQDLEVLRRLDGLHALAWPAVEGRFHYRRPGLHVITLRVHRLLRPLTLPSLARYDGCRSWVPLETPLPVAGAEPVLNEQAFARRVTAVREALVETARE